MKRIYISILTIVFAFGIAVPLAAQGGKPLSSPEITAREILYHISFLASDRLMGREAGTPEGRMAAAYIANEFERYGLKPAGDDGSFFQVFDFVSGVGLGENNRLDVRSGERLVSYAPEADFVPAGFSANGSVSGEAVFAGFGITANQAGYDDYAGIDADGKIVIVLTGSPAGGNPDTVFTQYEDLRYKAMNARMHGATALIAGGGYLAGGADVLPELAFDQAGGSAGIPVAVVRRDVLSRILENSGIDPAVAEEWIVSRREPDSAGLSTVRLSISVDLADIVSKTQNVAGYIEGNNPDADGEVIVIGAHYDHIGLGEYHSMTPSLAGEVHNGADDNASGTAGMLELAQYFSQPEFRPERTLLFIAFGAEEWGVLGSTEYTNHPFFPLEKTIAMFNMDMIGRMEDNTLTLNGFGTSPRWEAAANAVNAEYDFNLAYSMGGLGGSDHMPFYSKNIPVLFFFTGTHTDYHKPSDDVDLINLDGEVTILQFIRDVVTSIDDAPSRPVFQRVQEQSQERPPGGFSVTLGVVPDFTKTDVAGLAITDVVDGGPASEAGLKAGDVIVRLAKKDIANIYDYMYILGDLKAGQRVEVVVSRGGEEKTFTLVMRKRD